MTDKTAIDALKIAREALKERRAYCEQWEYKYADEWDNEDGYIQDAIDKLAAIEAEKPAEDAYNLAVELQTEIECGILIESVADMITHFAESYHAEQCRACRKDRQPLPEAPRV